MARGGKGRTAPEPPSQEAEARASEGPSPQVNNLFEQERGGVDAEEDAPVAGPLGHGPAESLEAASSGADPLASTTLRNLALSAA